MSRMSREELGDFVSQPLVGVLSVSRRERGPVAVPVWFVYQDGEFRVITSADSLHGRIMDRTDRATLTVHWEHYGDGASVERYVMAEGPIVFTDDDVVPGVYEVREKYYQNARAPEWVNKPIPPETLSQQIAVLRPETLSGFEWKESLP